MRQCEELAELAAQRRIEREARVRRTIELRDKGLPSTVIAVRVRASVDWVNRTIRASGRRALSPWEAPDCTGTTSI